ncbi:MAG: ABC transporter permease subunit [Candidatus Pacebacteria bacterium]|nr:ABC transporter permease subunit [Candidatus Paceibacterota bacterium]
MVSYIIRRLLLMVPTIFGILTITFLVIQLVPGGPLDQIRQMVERSEAGGGMEAAGGAQFGESEASRQGGLAPEDFEKLKKVYHLDRPWYERYMRTFIWFSRKDPDSSLLTAFFTWDNWDGMLLLKFGDSFYRNRNVLELIMDKLPVSASLGLWSFLLTYPSCILLGIVKAVREGTRLDIMTSILILIGYSIPGFVLAVLIIVLFGPGDAAIAHLVPLSGLTSAGVYGYEQWSLWAKVMDYFHHVAAPVICLSIGSFAVLTILTKNSVLEEVRKQYVLTARAKGLSGKRVLFKHILRNSMIPLVTGFPSRFVAIFFTGSVLIERIFNLDGIGLLGYTAVIQRDYPVVMGNLFVMTLLGLFLQLITDICYVLVDPRISFESRST